MDKLFRESRKNIYFRKDRDVNFPTHIHDHIELVYVFQGSGNAFCDGKQYPLSPGSVFTVFPNQVHSFSGCTDGEYILLVIHPSRLLHLEAFFRSRVPVSALSQGTPELAQLLDNALGEFRDNADINVVYGYLTVFFSKLFSSMAFQASTELSDTVSQILQYCSTHYLESVTTQNLCDALHISQSQVSHLFSKRLKISFPDYMNALRLNRAVSLLQSSGLNMTQIANQAGFPTIRTFNRVFRKQYGCSPSEYRNRHKATKSANK
jgi:AraC-like DNA-binding protein